MWVEGTCGWREHVREGNMWVEGTSCDVGGGSIM